MCNRYRVEHEIRETKVRFEVKHVAENVRTGIELYPQYFGPIVIEQDGRWLCQYQWGINPKWAKDHKIGRTMVNARAETFLEKRSYKNLIAKNWCLPRPVCFKVENCDFKVSASCLLGSPEQSKKNKSALKVATAQKAPKKGDFLPSRC